MNRNPFKCTHSEKKKITMGTEQAGVPLIHKFAYPSAKKFLGQPPIPLHQSLLQIVIGSFLKGQKMWKLQEDKSLQHAGCLSTSHSMAFSSSGHMQMGTVPEQDNSFIKFTHTLHRQLDAILWQCSSNLHIAWNYHHAIFTSLGPLKESPWRLYIHNGWWCTGGSSAVV